MIGTDPHNLFEREEMERHLSRSEVEVLNRRGLIEPEDHQAALEAYRLSVDWPVWIRLWAGVIGAVFLLTGVLFFFAHNWKEMSPLLRFGILEGAIAVTVVGAALVRFRSTIGQWLLVGASVLTGILIAVYGQVYQAGADAFEVFALWAGLMLVWVVVARFAPLWLFWLMIAETALVLYGGQVLVPDEMASWSTVFLLTGAAAFFSLAVWEWFQKRHGGEWLRGEWIRVGLVLAALFWLSMIPWRWIFDWGYRDSDADLMKVVGTLSWLAAVVGGTWFYTMKRRSILGLSFSIICFTVIFACMTGRLVLEDNWDEPVGWLIAAILAIGIFGGATALIGRLSKLPISTAESSREETV